MKYLRNFWPYFAIGLIVLAFFWPVFKGYIPFPGDLLVSQTPYKAQSYLGYPPGGYPNKAQGPDVINEIYPWRFFAVSQLKQGQIPFWNPYNFSGNPQMADFQSAVFYPFNFLYLLLPFNFAWTLIIMLQPLLAALFMYLFLKKGVGLKDFPAFLGGVAFGFSSYMTVWIEYGNIGSTILWLPLTLLFAKSYFKKPMARNFLGIVLSLSVAIVAGYIQGVFYTYVVLFLYYVFLIFTDKQNIKNYRKNLLFMASLIIPFFLTSFQILPTLELFSQSTRGAYALSQIEKNLAPVYYWVTGFFPDFFGNPATRNYWLNGTYIERVLYPGGLIMFFAAYAIFNKSKFLEKRFFLILAALSLVIATNLPLIKFFYLIPIPVISTTVATREFSVFIFSVIVLGSLGLEHFITEEKFKWKTAYLYILFYILVWAAVLALIKISPNLSLNLKVTIRNLVLPTLILIGILAGVFIKKFSVKASMVLLTLILVFDLFYFFNKITPFSPQALIYPETPVQTKLKDISGISRVWGYGSAYIPANFATVDMNYSPEGNDPLHISRYGELLASSDNGNPPVMLPRPDANIAPGYGVSDLKSNFYRKRILDLLGVKYILNEQDLVNAWQSPDYNTFPQSSYTLVSKIYPWQVYQNNGALPRFFVSGDYKVAENKAQALSLIYGTNIDLGRTVILEENPDIKIDENSTGSAKLVSYGPNDVIIDTKTTGNALLFLSDNFYPDWAVKIDGKPSTILLADYAFRAVALTSGNHRVVFYYKPESFILGLGIGAAGLIMLFFLTFYVKNNKKI